MRQSLLKDTIPRVAILNVVLAIAISINLAACDEDRTCTVDEFKADRTLREETITTCANNPANLDKTPNCINARQAAWKVRLENMR